MESILSEHDGAGNDTPMDFDTLFDTKALRIMRVLIPFFPASHQPFLAVWVRFSQLKYALSLINDRRFLSGMAGMARPKSSDDSLLPQLLSALKPCLSEAEYQELARMQNMFSMYQRFQKLMPYLSALDGMSGDLSAADMMNVFSAMQGGCAPAADMMNVFSAMQDGRAPAADRMDAFSAMQDGRAPAANTQPGTDTASAARDETISAADAGQPRSDDSDSSTGHGSYMDMGRILDLISLFQASPDGTNAEANSSERQDEQKHE